MKSSSSRYAGTFASVGGTLGGGYLAPTWRQVTCPKEGCEAPPQTKCRRRISETFNANAANGHIGEGRWQALKHPHPERKRAAREETS